MEPITEEVWRRLLRRSRAEASVPLFGPLLARDRLVLGRLAQTLDGFIATASGQSQWISGTQDVTHTHRLRALFDAVVVGAGTVRADNPQLTTRLVEGPSPTRVVLDADRRLGTDYKVFGAGPPTLLLCAADAGNGATRHGAAEIVALPRGRDGIDPQVVLDCLASRGLRRVFVEGGGVTVSRFLAAGALDRMHLTVAPMLIGGGIRAFPLPAAGELAQAMRFGWSMHRVGDDVLMDIALT